MDSDGVRPTTALVDFLAGTVGGVASLVAGHPFDTIKTRLQAQSHAPALRIQHASAAVNASSPLLQPTAIPTYHYKSSIDALRRIIAEERFFGLYKGVTSPMLGVAVMNASIFGIYGLALRQLQGTDDKSSLQDVFIAGCASGVVSALITAPIDLIKIRQQLSGVHSTESRGTIEVIRDVWKQGGVRGIYRGLGCTCIRDLGYGPYFFSYEVINRYLFSLRPRTNEGLTSMETALSGGLAGMVAWVSTFGADVIKTRVQATNRRPGVRFAFLTAASDTYQEGGWRAFFAGIRPTILRALPVNAVLFITYESTKDLLTKKGY